MTMAETLKLLAIFPRPDDESLGLGGTLAMYSAESVETTLICATRGERRWKCPEEQNPGFEVLRRIRPQAVTIHIDMRAYFDTAWQAILCHKSQLAGYGPLVKLTREALLKFWSEGTFVRVISLVNCGRAVETDLFVWLRKHDSQGEKINRINVRRSGR